MNGSGSKSGTTVTKTEPWEGSKPYLQGLYSKAEEAYGATPKAPYQGQLTAGPNLKSQHAAFMAEQNALQNADLGATARAGAQRIGDRLSSGDYLTLPTQGGIDMGNMNNATQSITSQLQMPQLNLEGVQAQSPTTQAAIEASIAPVKRQLLEQIMPQIQSASIENGAYGGQRQGVVQQGALDDFTRNAQEISARLGYEDLARRQGIHADDIGQQRQIGLEDTLTRMGLGAQDLSEQRRLGMENVFDQRANALRGLQLEGQAAGQAANLSGQAFEQNMQPAQVMQNVGQQWQDWEQGQLSDAFTRYQLAQQAPWAGLSELAAALGSGGQFSTGTQQVPTASTGTRALTGGLGGALTGAQLAPLLGLAGPWGAAGGAILGGLSGLF